MRKVENLLSKRKRTREERQQAAIELAKALHDAAKKERTHKEAKHEKWMAKMMSDPQGRTFMTLFTDQAFRAKSHARTADQLVYLLKKMGVPRFFSEFDRLKFLLFKWLGNSFPDFFINQIKQQLRKEMSNVLVPDNPKKFNALSKKSREEGIELNLNRLGEAILSEDEAERRLNRYIDDFDNPNITYVSIKVSTLFSQINMVAFEESLEVLEERLTMLYRAAGSKFVNLDMEEYKDLDLTVELFKRVLMREEFKTYYGGIVLQAYLPNAFEKLQELTQWAKKRGAPIKIRLVKGANLALEQVESSMHDWPLATFSSKVESDANYKRMLEYAMENTEFVYLGVASHNLFDIAYALLLRAEHGCEKRVNFEMLSGMAEPIQRVITKLTKSVVLYAPEAGAKNFDHAISYLIRRLDENGGPENFLRHFYHLKKQDVWQEQVKQFMHACSLIETLSTKARRLEQKAADPRFSNEPDIDFSMPVGRELAKRAMEEKSFRRIPNGEGEVAIGIDPSKPEKPLYEYALATSTDVEKMLHAAKPAPQNVLQKVAALMRARKEELLNVMLADVGKNVLEGNGEVSEAIDFLEYYSRTDLPPDYEWHACGTILVAPPWNFSLSIPVGGIAAALAAGNAVIFKPAPEAVLVGWTLVQLFWEAGIPKESLQFLCCKDDPTGSELIKNPKIHGVILTGATSTALKFLQMRPDLHLMAETGGKNALIVSSMCDRDLAIKDIIQSAFNYSGQKCSACSLLILEKELYRDDHFLNQLKEAVQSLPVGSAWNPESVITPLIHPPEEDLRRALTTVEDGEEWLLKPHADPNNPHLWSPGIKLHVKEGSYTHQTEFFGPLLAVMCADNIPHAIEMANSTPYGLTSGIHTLDEREKELWLSKIEAGNLYINRSITGAIVQRQPFGGCKASSFGPGAKAGGPHYVEQFMVPKELRLPNEEAKLPPSVVPILAILRNYLTEKECDTFLKSARSYVLWAKKLQTPQDLSQIHGQENLFYMVPRDKIILRIEKEDKPLDYLRVIAACSICETPLEISCDEPILPELRIPEATEGGRIRHLSTPVFASGRLELLHYLREVALSHNTHRYGYLYETRL